MEVAWRGDGLGGAGASAACTIARCAQRAQVVPSAAAPAARPSGAGALACRAGLRLWLADVSTFALECERCDAWLEALAECGL